MPKVVSHEARRAEVVAAARWVVAHEGLEAATVRRIAERMGCATGRITHYYPDKHQVLIGVLREVHRSAAQRMLAADAGASPLDRLRAVLAEALPLDRERHEEWRVWLAFWGAAIGDPALRAEQRARYAEWESLVARLLADLRARVRADEVVAVVDGIGLRATLEPRAFPRARQVGLVEEYLHQRVLPSGRRRPEG